MLYLKWKELDKADMRKSIGSRLCGIIIILAMLIAGVSHSSDSAVSLFGATPDNANASIMLKVSNRVETNAYLETSSAEITEGADVARQSVRTVFGSLKIRQIITISLLLIDVFALSLCIQMSVLLTSAVHNQYSHRTLAYIHHKDGKTHNQD